MTVSVRGVSMSPDLTAQVTAFTARRRTSGEMPEALLAAAFMSAGAAVAARTGVRVAVGDVLVTDPAAGATAGAVTAAAADELVPAGPVPVPSIGIPHRHTSAPAARLRTLPFNLLTS